MPFRDGRGPDGRGPGTGWGRGPCIRPYGLGSTVRSLTGLLRGGRAAGRAALPGRNLPLYGCAALALFRWAGGRFGRRRR